VQGFAGLLLQRLLEGHMQEAVAYTEHIERAAQRMTAMINALSSLAQVTRQPLHRQFTEMRRLAQDSWSMLAASNPGRRVDFRLDELPAVQADADLAAQVWQNLLGNAWKYSNGVPEPRVSVSSYRNERGNWYRVADNGAGFDMAQAQALFQPFQRMHKGPQFEGTGVGLSLVRRIIDHHGGDIRIRSQPGVGTVAEFTLDPAP
jgi:signal transduction histidine kinase